MLLAQSKDRLIWAEDANSTMKLVCPGCKQKVIFRCGQHKIAHFAHVRQANCGFSEGETTEHLKGKQQIYYWAQAKGWAPQLELYLPSISQRPDLLLTINGRKVAIEFQCSPLSLHRLMERNNGYHQLGIRVWWLLGQPYQRCLGNKKVIQFTEYVGKRPVILYWDTNQERIFQRDFNRCSYTKLRFNQAAILKQQINHLKKLAGRYPSKLEQQLLLAAYPYKLEQCPLVCHDLVPTWPALDYPLILWRIKVIIKLAKFPLFFSWSRRNWRKWLSQTVGRYPQPGCLDKMALLLRVFQQFTCELISNQFLVLNDQYLILVRRPQWFGNPQEKFLALANTNNKCK